MAFHHGDLLSNGGSDPTTCSTPNIDNDNGTLTNITCRRNTEDGVTGTGVLATINFEAIGVGEPALIIEEASCSNPKGEAIEFTARDGRVTVYGPHAKITGKVTDSLGNPVSGVEVKVFLNDQPVGINDETDWSGNYLIDNITQASWVTVVANTKPSVMSINPLTVDVQIGQTTENVDFTIFEPTPLHSVVDAEGFIRNWLLLGPIPWENDTTRLRADQLDAETKPDIRLPVQEKNRKDLFPKDSNFGTGLAKNQKWTLHIEDNRQYPKGHQAFSEIWKTDKLWVSLDRANMKPPTRPGKPEWDNRGMIHWDVDTSKTPIAFGVQGVLYLTDTAENQGGSQCIPGFHKQFYNCSLIHRRWLQQPHCQVTHGRNYQSLIILGPISSVHPACQISLNIVHLQVFSS